MPDKETEQILTLRVPKNIAENTLAKETTVKAINAKEAKKGMTFESFLVFTVLIVAIIGAYESVTELSMPALSILSLVHGYGYLKSYPIVYEPNKGIWHMLGWTGSLMMVVMMLYSVRKRLAVMNSLGTLRHWLSGHMFLGILGPLLVTLHTTFKLNGIITTSFWCMITTMVFGIVGRYIYIQVPRSITGAELGVQDIDRIVDNLNEQLHRHLNNADLTHLFNAISVPYDKARQVSPLTALFLMVKTDIENIFKISRLRSMLKKHYGALHWRIREEIEELLKKKAALIRRRNFFDASHRLLHYWHVFHVPLAVVMFLIMFIHIIVYYIFRVGH
ncbi:hypothetical protein EPN18_06740 [bacterium]|nr:MAG: hypothetical protein EPN18_06740 [bacterium]